MADMGLVPKMCCRELGPEHGNLRKQVITCVLLTLSLLAHLEFKIRWVNNGHCNRVLGK